MHLCSLTNCSIGQGRQTRQVTVTLGAKGA